MPSSAATLSAVCGMVSSPYCFSTLGLGKRAPMVLSKARKSREKGLSLLAMTKGARLMLSAPPATNSSPSPALTARAASRMAARLEPHRRLTVTPATRSEEHTSELQSRENLVCRLLLEKKKETIAV